MACMNDISERYQLVNRGVTVGLRAEVAQLGSAEFSRCPTWSAKADILQPAKIHFINTFFGRPGVVPPALLAAGHVSYAKGVAGMFDFYSAASLCHPVQMQALSPADRHEDQVRARLQCTAFCI